MSSAEAAVVKSPYRFEAWTLSVTDHLRWFKAWAGSLHQSDAVGLGAIGWVILNPFLTIVALFVTPWHFKTVVFSIGYFLFTAWCVMLCYHRMLSHKSFKTPGWVRAFFLAVSTSAMEGPALGWVRNHRAHHRFLDTDRDPYNAMKGFWWSHMGWALHPYDPKEFEDIDTSDLTSDPHVMAQLNYYPVLALATGFLFPTLVCGFGWGDYAGGFWIGAIIRMGLLLQSAFFTNSLAHFSGHHTFTDATTPVDNWLVHLLTTGEGYHNFHHAFPYDYRGTSDMTAIDPLKWLAYGLSLFGLASDLKRFPDNLITHARLETTKARVEKDMLKFSPCKPLSELPEMSTADVRRRVQEGASLIIVDQLVVDVHDFLPNHPGGEPLIKAFFGKDATKAFYGNTTQHTPGAKKILESLVMARIVDVDTKKD